MYTSARNFLWRSPITRDFVDTVEDVFDNCLTGLSSWIINCFYCGLTVNVYAASPTLAVIPHLFDC